MDLDEGLEDAVARDTIRDLGALTAPVVAACTMTGPKTFYVATERALCAFRFEGSRERLVGSVVPWRDVEGLRVATVSGTAVGEAHDHEVRVSATLPDVAIQPEPLSGRPFREHQRKMILEFAAACLTLRAT